ncbi:MAG: hypothetical protein ACLP01_24250 [Solirubrobacteraceae bacterium]
MTVADDVFDREILAYEKASNAPRPLEPLLTKAMGWMLHHDQIAAGAFARMLVTSLRPIILRSPQSSDAQWST